MVSVRQELVAMQSSVVAASSLCIRNAVELRDPCMLSLRSGAPDGRKDKEFEGGNEKLLVVSEFRYLGDMPTEEVAAS